MTVRNPQKFHSAEYVDIESLVVMPNVVFEQKCDGIRALIIMRHAGDGTPSITFHTHGGRVLKSSAAAQWFDKVKAQLAPLYSSAYTEFEVVLDGEIMIEDGALHLFDLPYLRIEEAECKPVMPFSYRRAYLESVGRTLIERGATSVSVVKQARTEDEKRELYQSIFRMGGEGIMAKDVTSPYNEGDRVKHSLKCKFVRTADVFVTARNVGESGGQKGGDKENAEFAVIDQATGFTKQMGRCSMIGKADAQVGDVIEVVYLFVGSGGVLYQPRMVGMRTDKVPTDCTDAQFETYSKVVLT